MSISDYVIKLEQLQQIAKSQKKEVLDGVLTYWPINLFELNWWIGLIYGEIDCTEVLFWIALINQFIYLFVYLFIYLFIHSFILLFIYPIKKWPTINLSYYTTKTREVNKETNSRTERQIQKTMLTIKYIICNCVISKFPSIPVN